MRTLTLVVLALVVGLVAPGCWLLESRQVQLDPADPVLVELKSARDQGMLDYATFEKRVQDHLGVAVTQIQADLEATAPSVAKTVADAVKAEVKANPPPVGGGIPDWVLWIASIAGVGVSAGAANVALKQRKATAPAPGVQPAPVPTGGA